MNRNVLESWVFGAVALTLLVAFHWYAFRIGKSRSRPARATDVRGRRGTDPGERVFANEPLRPR